MSKKRSLEMDLMKIVSCLAVIMIHVTATPATMTIPVGASAPPIQILSIFLNGISLFAVPSFILISGMALMLGYKDRPIIYGDFMIKRCKVIAIPYLIWCLGYYFFYAALGLRELNIKEFAACILLGRANYHLYFIPIILQMYAVFPLIKGLLNKLDTRLGILLVFAAHLIYQYQIPTFMFRDRFFMSYFIFFAVGMLLGKHFEGVRLILKTYWLPVAALYLVAAGMHVVGKYNLYVHGSGTILNLPQIWVIFSLISTLTLFAFSSKISDLIITQRTSAVVSNLSAATFYVYLAHPMLLNFTQKLYRVIGLDSITWTLALNFSILTCVCFSLSLLYLKSKKRLQPLA